ncbi:MAG: MBL fold metallo-hydrolase [Desulfovibrionaceae bacterium]
MTKDAGGHAFTRLTVLVDNERPPQPGDAPPGESPALASEWGLAMALERPSDGALWLWDAGASPCIITNAASLGVDLSRARGLALSHGHWDHTGGILALLRAGFRGPVYLHPAGLSKRWHVDPQGPGAKGKARRVEEIGIREELPPTTPVRGVVELDEGLHLLTDVPRLPGNREAVDHFFFDAAGTRPDRVEDDAFLVVRSPEGEAAVILGCCHSGLANSLEHMRGTLGIDKVSTLVGGLHLYEADEIALEQAVEAVKRFGIRRIFAGHCTGRLGVEFLRRGLEPLGCEVVWTGSGTRADLFGD